MEPQFPDLPPEVSCVRLAEIFGMPGEQADEEVDPAEVPVRQAGQPLCRHPQIATANANGPRQKRACQFSSG
jgi:hypothetical protein